MSAEETFSQQTEDKEHCLCPQAHPDQCHGRTTNWRWGNRGQDSDVDAQNLLVDLRRFWKHADAPKDISVDGDRKKQGDVENDDNEGDTEQDSFTQIRDTCEESVFDIARPNRLVGNDNENGICSASKMIRWLMNCMIRMRRPKQSGEKRLVEMDTG